MPYDFHYEIGSFFGPLWFGKTKQSNLREYLEKGERIKCTSRHNWTQNDLNSRGLFGYEIQFRGGDSEIPHQNLPQNHLLNITMKSVQQCVWLQNRFNPFLMNVNFWRTNCIAIIFLLDSSSLSANISICSGSATSNLVALISSYWLCHIFIVELFVLA